MTDINLQKLIDVLKIVYNADVHDGDLHQNDMYVSPIDGVRRTAADIVGDALQLVDPVAGGFSEAIKPGAYQDES